MMSSMWRLAVIVPVLLALAPALAGMFAGQWLRSRVSPATFRLCFFVGLLALGLHLASRAVLCAGRQSTMPRFVQR